jgi:uncharacterized membrane-anchored protein YhcB (DUF1043 family)
MSIIEGGLSPAIPKPDLDQLKLPTDTWKTHTFSDLGAKIQNSFGGDPKAKGPLDKVKEMGSAVVKFRDAPLTKSSKKEKCYWIAVICALVAVAVFVGLSVAAGPGGMVLALQLAMIPGVVGGALYAVGRKKAIKEKKLKEWDMPKLPDDVDKIKAEVLWHARSTAKYNMEMNQKQITELKTRLELAKLAKLPTEKIQAEIEKRRDDKMELFKDFEDKAVTFWSLAKPKRGEALKERFNEDRQLRGEKELFQIQELPGDKEKFDLSSG